jgi:hypothetical protein
MSQTYSSLPASIDEPIRFAVGNGDGLTSHSWRIWSEKRSELYLACRDSFKETKVSLHASGRWRMGYTQQAVLANPALAGGGKNRAWEVWDKPSPIMPDVVMAFSIYFPTSEFVMTPEQRNAKSWRDVRFVRSAEPNFVSVISICIGGRFLEIEHTAASTELGRFNLPNDKVAYVIAHDADDADVMRKVRRARALMQITVTANNADQTADYFAYFLAHRPDGCRNLLGVKMPSRNV